MKRVDNRSKSVTMADIASALGVSNVTVSNALAGKKGVSAKLRAEVLLKARELGYRTEEETAEVVRDEKARGDIGIIAPQRYMDSRNGFHWQLYQELIAQLKAYDKYAILDVVSESDEYSLSTPRIIENQLVAGLIILGRPSLRFLGEISKCDLPVIFLDFSVRNYNFTSIAGDDYYDMNRLTSFIMSHGHSNICYVTEKHEELERDRYFGYCRALSESEISAPQPCTLEQAMEQAEEMRYTAYVCENPSLAQKLIKSLQTASISVPDMASVACFSDIKHDSENEITCICREPSQMARLAVDALREKLSGEEKNVGRIAVSGRIIAGNTMKSIII